ncbi:MAG: hypothetical protein JW808_11560 [Victivallales bacterium]|nr:hypothetical protein [Victivallales bacterium]
MSDILELRRNEMSDPIVKLRVNRIVSAGAAASRITMVLVLSVWYSVVHANDPVPISRDPRDLISADAKMITMVCYPKALLETKMGRALEKRNPQVPEAKKEDIGSRGSARCIIYLLDDTYVHVEYGPLDYTDILKYWNDNLKDHAVSTHRGHEIHSGISQIDSAKLSGTFSHKTLLSKDMFVASGTIEGIKKAIDVIEGDAPSQKVSPGLPGLDMLEGAYPQFFNSDFSNGQFMGFSIPEELLKDIKKSSSFIGITKDGNYCRRLVVSAGSEGTISALKELFDSGKALPPVPDTPENRFEVEMRKISTSTDGKTLTIHSEVTAEEYDKLMEKK